MSIFFEVDFEIIGDLSQQFVGWVLIYVDVDGDGDFDVLLLQIGGLLLFLCNDQVFGYYWLCFQFVFVGGCVDVFGVCVEVMIEGCLQWCELILFCSYQSQVELVLIFGLGMLMSVVVCVVWLDGMESDFDGFEID